MGQVTYWLRSFVVAGWRSLKGRVVGDEVFLEDFSLSKGGPIW